MLPQGHYDIEKMSLWAQEAVYWPGITSDIKTSKATCKICAICSKSPQETLQPHEVLNRVDLFQLNRIHHLLVVHCYSSFPVLRALHSLTTTAITRTSSKYSQNMEFPKLSWLIEVLNLTAKSLGTLLSNAVSPTLYHHQDTHSWVAEWFVHTIKPTPPNP